MPSYDAEQFQDEDVKWDLRTTWVKYITLYLLQMFEFKSKRNYQGWFSNLKLMKPAIFGRVMKNKADEEKAYTELVEKAVKTFVRYRNDYLNLSSTSEGASVISDSLSNIEEYLVYLMQKNKMFGGSTTNRGL